MPMLAVLGRRQRSLLSRCCSLWQGCLQVGDENPTNLLQAAVISAVMLSRLNISDNLLRSPERTTRRISIPEHSSMHCTNQPTKQ
jgi:hypothetical protein